MAAAHPVLAINKVKKGDVMVSKIISCVIGLIIGSYLLDYVSITPQIELHGMRFIASLFIDLCVIFSIYDILEKLKSLINKRNKKDNQPIP